MKKEKSMLSRGQKIFILLFRSQIKFYFILISKWIEFVKSFILLTGKGGNFANIIEFIILY